MKISMDDAVWKLLERAQILVNKTLLEEGKKPLLPSGVLSMILQQALVQNSVEILDEHEQLGAAGLIGHLTKLDPSTANVLPRPVAPSTPAVPKRGGTRRRTAPDVIIKCPKERALSRAPALPSRSPVPRQPGAPRQVRGGLAGAFERAGLHEAAALIRREEEARRSSAGLHVGEQAEAPKPQPLASTEDAGAETPEFHRAG